MLRNLFGIPVLCLALTAELILSAQLVVDLGLSITMSAWLFSHTMASALAAFCTSILFKELVPGKRVPLLFFLFLTGFFLPFIGALGIWLSITFGAIIARGRHQQKEFWQFTSNAELPFAAPIDRPLPKLDSRGFIEQLAFDPETEKLYKKVAGTRHIRDSQAGPILKQAVGHENDRIRLVAYQMLDKKVNTLNREIQRLESDARAASGAGKSNIHLQIANNYWELLTLEEDEPIAREELLGKAHGHALKAAELDSKNVNVHFTIGQINLKQGDSQSAIASFERSISLGISKDKALPYIAEAAYKMRDFVKLRTTLDQVSPAFKTYPPFSNVIEYWA
ncbi:hypothetical protein AB833_19755 [Chromatiales bacterium (ex Bugula neritina AB1)]|nr:hypothetical protein AB833_19755 [Chromatiales bacterium (ex Bugula neritina AB1)]